MPGYLVKQQRVAIASVADLQIQSLLDRQQYADPLGKAEALGISSASWPLFGMLWPAGLQLAAVMAQRPLQAEESILELGCGLALASLVSHRRGALVTASDCHPLAGRFLLENLRLNGLPPMRYCHGDWGSTPHLDDDQLPRVQGCFDLIIGSDVLYERDDGGALAAFISRHAQARSELIIIDPNRGNRAAFNRQMAVLGFTLEETFIEQGGFRGRLLNFRRHNRISATN